MLHERATAVVVYVTTAGWAVNLVASMLPWLEYESDPMIHTAFMAVVGGALGVQAWRQRGGNRESDQL